jgi:hypothetical protein
MRKHYRLVWCFSIPLFLLIAECSKPILKMPESLPPIVKEYKHIKLDGNRPGMVNTGVHLSKDDSFSILATGSIDVWPRGAFPGFKYHDVRPEHGWPFMLRIGEGAGQNAAFAGLFGKNGMTYDAWRSGNLYLGIRDDKVDIYGEPFYPDYYRDNVGFFSVDIIVWEKQDLTQIADFFEKMEKNDPDNKAIKDALRDAKVQKELEIASMNASKEIEETKKKIEDLKAEPEQKEQQAIQAGSHEESGVQSKPPSVEASKEERIAQLETKLAKLTQTLAELQEMEKKLSEERKKSSLLSEELEESKRKEKDLLVKLREGSNAPPVIVIASPKDGIRVESNIIHLSGVAEDDKGVARLEMFINDKPIIGETDLGLRLTGGENQRRVNISERIVLEKGENQIRIRAVDSDGLWSENRVTVHKLEIRRNIWAVVIGINAYPNLQQLKFAVNDARMFYDHLVNDNKIPAENVILLVEREATLTKLRSALGTHLKNKGGKEDMVIIFFAGHGATEKDVMSPDGDGLEKYLLPYDADPKDLYATALPMEEISRIFKRIRSERLVFFADSCYSGASGGRTIDIAGIRASISDAFLDRIASGKGRVIMTASGANEVSAENDELEHGVFTYYLVEGLKGMADVDEDGLITVEEVYRYVSDKVPQATGQEQHPVKKGTVEGRLILGIVNTENPRKP